MVAAVRMGFGRAVRWSLGGRAWATGWSAGMLLVGVAVVLVAWSGGPSLDMPGAAIEARDVDVDDSAGIIVTVDDADIFGVPLRPFEEPDGAPSGVPDALRAGSDGGARGAASPPGPITGTGTSTSTPPAPVTTTPTPGGGSNAGTGTGTGTSASAGVGSTAPTAPPTPTPIVDGKVNGSSGTAVVTVEAQVTGAGSVALAADTPLVGAATAIDAPAASTSTTVDLGVTSATVDTSTHSAAVTAGDITLTVPLAGALLG